MFSSSVRQEGLSRIDQARQKQTMVPDIRITLPQGGETKPVLHELKTTNLQQRGGLSTFEQVLCRGEYLKKARDADRLYNGTDEGEVGSVESKLMELG